MPCAAVAWGHHRLGQRPGMQRRHAATNGSKFACEGIGDALHHEITNSGTHRRRFSEESRAGTARPERVSEQRLV